MAQITGVFKMIAKDSTKELRYSAGAVGNCGVNQLAFLGDALALSTIYGQPFAIRPCGHERYKVLPTKYNEELMRLFKGYKATQKGYSTISDVVPGNIPKIPSEGSAAKYIDREKIRAARGFTSEEFKEENRAFAGECRNIPATRISNLELQKKVLIDFLKDWQKTTSSEILSKRIEEFIKFAEIPSYTEIKDFPNPPALYGAT